MNPNPFLATFTPAALNATGIATGLTGAGPFTTFTANGPADKLGHQVTLTSAANLSAINMTIVGTDINGNALTEVIAGPNANTVTTKGHFATVTSITAASTLGANTMNVGWNNDSVTPWYNLNYSVAAFLASVAAVITAGAATFQFEHTYDAPNDAAVPFVDGLAASANAEYAYNAVTRATRMHITANTAATLDYYILQGAH